MTRTDPPPPSREASREERLAQQLRANLRRRKAQARELDSRAQSAQEPDAAEAGGKSDLPKS